MKITSKESLISQVGAVVRMKINHTRAVAEMEREVVAVQKRHAAKIDTLLTDIAEAEADILDYSTANRATLFTDAKSIDLPSAVIGFEFTPPRVETTSKRIKWSDVIARLGRLGWGKAYLTTPEPKLDKNALLADRTNLTPEQQLTAGIRFVQDEQFFIRPKLETAPDTTTTT